MNPLNIFLKLQNTIYCDANKKGNNHACKEYNTVFVVVFIGENPTVYVRAIKDINENEFLSIDYENNYKIKNCRCFSCQNKKNEETKVTLNSSFKN